ncbi:MAG: AzlC family ABC transporter permease [Anaerolineales bacterium]|nr:AzlC family ABC transporter permease [Anaerolineales bacterium]
MHANHAIPSLNTPRREFLSGVKSELPLMVGVIPFGMIYGILAIAAGLPPSVAQAMSFIIFAGSSQFVSAQLYGLGVPAMLNVFTVWVINLRHALYSASVASYLQKLPTRWKLILAYLLTDEAYAVTIIHYQQEGDKRYRHWYFLGAGLTLWTTWQMSTAMGIFLGATIPASWSLDFTLALIFIALVVPSLKDKASLGAALSAGVAAIILFSLPLKTGLLVASLIGIAVGMLVERRS